MKDIYQRTLERVLETMLPTLADREKWMPLFEEQPFRVTDTGIHAKVLSDWNAKGLLLEKPEKNRMHRFSFTEIVWVKMIEKLRAFNIPSNTIAMMRNEMAAVQGTNAHLLRSDPRLKDMLRHVFGDEAALMIKEIENEQLWSQVVESLPSMVMQPRLIDMLVGFCVYTGNPMSVIINERGQGLLLNPVILSEGGYGERDITILLGSSFVCISLLEIIGSVIELAPVSELSELLRVISDKEAIVLDALRTRNVSSVTVKLNNGEIDLLEVAKQQNVSPIAKMSELIVSNGYHDITIKTQNGKVVYCENTRKMKL